MEQELREILKNKKDFDQIPQTGRMIPVQSLFAEEELHAVSNMSSVFVEFGGINYVLQASRVKTAKVPEGTKIIRDTQNRAVGINAISAGISQ